MPPAKKPPPGNPTWIEWLEEWAEEKKGSEHFARAIKKAIKSFKDCPVPIDHPSNAVELKNVGPTTVRYLTNRLIKYCEEEGLEMPVPRVHSFEDQAAKASKKRKQLTIGLAGQDGVTNDSNLNGADSEAEINTSPPKKPKPAARPYAPKLRSGPFALLVGLGSYGVDAWKTREEIVERGDPFFGAEGASLLDKDNRLASNPAIGFSGWQSMAKTLIAKGLCEKKGARPTKYHITNDGWKIARKAIRKAQSDFPNSDVPLPYFETDEEDSDAGGRAAERLSQSQRPIMQIKDKVRKSPAKPVAIDPNSSDAPFLYCYLDADKNRVRRKDEADIQMHPTEFTSLFLVEFRKAQEKHIFARRNISQAFVLLRDELGPEGPTLEGYLAARHALPVSPGFDSLPAVYPAPGSKPAFQVARSSSPPKKSPQAPRGGRAPLQPSSSNGHLASSPRKSQNPPPDVIEIDLDTPAQKAGNASESRAPVTRTISRPLFRLSSPEIQELNPTTLRPAPAGPRSSSSLAPVFRKATTESNPLKTVTMPAGSYDINLVLDAREKPGLSNKKLEKLLTEKGVPWQAKTLAMGDAVWIAECKETGLEVVLDCCLERKRLDDLISSLKDGRYAEQKNRMKRSGISRLIYLVEEHDKRSETYYGPQIWSIKSSLQVFDGFNVYIAWTPQDAIRYLTMLTTTMSELYKHTTLTALPDTAVEQETYEDFIKNLRKSRPATTFVTTYTAYQKINGKAHSIGTNWAKMIASVDQMSMEKTIRFLERFPTPAQFFSELDETIDEDERIASETSSQRFKKGQGNHGECWIMRQTVTEEEAQTAVRPIGQALSTHCWKLFTARKY